MNHLESSMLFHSVAVPICNPINSGQGSGCPVPSVYTSVNLLFMFWAIVILMETKFFIAVWWCWTYFHTYWTFICCYLKMCGQLLHPLLNQAFCSDYWYYYAVEFLCACPFMCGKTYYLWQFVCVCVCVCLLLVMQFKVAPNSLYSPSCPFGCFSHQCWDNTWEIVWR